MKNTHEKLDENIFYKHKQMLYNNDIDKVITDNLKIK